MPRSWPGRSERWGPIVNAVASGVVDLVVAPRKKFGVEIHNDERIRSIRTLGDIYVFIRVVR
ncbi:MAG: acyl carrier protein [Verrucomicrobiota bacterium]|nr:acyl carrier protein [Verrucomicrobiota bacterium]